MNREWIERWFGSEPNKGSWIYDKAANSPIVFVGKTERDHDYCCQVVFEHNAALKPANAVEIFHNLS